MEREELYSLASRAVEFLNQDEFYSPLALLLGGLLVLSFGTLLRRFVNFQKSRGKFFKVKDSVTWALLERFENRMRVSWVLVAFGALWLLQLVIENHTVTRFPASFH